MKKSDTLVTNELTADERRMVVNSILTRRDLYYQMGKQYAGERDLTKALGYAENIKQDDYLTKYQRLDIATAVIDRPVNATWRGGIEVIEDNDKVRVAPEDITPLEKAWEELNDKLDLTGKFSRVDKMTGLGEYAVLVLGFSGSGEEDQMREPVSKGADLIYVKPYLQKNADITEWETDPSNERYGFPTIYKITTTEVGSAVSTSVDVHWSRVIHIAEGKLESEIYGKPRLESIYNRLYDLEKVVGGSAEMFWRNARPGFQGKVDPEFAMGEDMKNDLRNQIDEYEHNLRRILVNEGVELSSLTQPFSDPRSAVDIQIEMISAETGIPKRILTGSERGELASMEDRNNWFDLIQFRREGFAEEMIVRPFIDLGMKYGFLPSIKGSYEVVWEDLYAQSEKEKAEIGQTRATTMATYARGGSELLSPEVFIREFLGFESEKADQMLEDSTEYLKEEAQKAEEDEKLMREQQEAQLQAVKKGQQVVKKPNIKG